MTQDYKLSTRQQNLNSLLHLLDENDELSAKQLATLTGLSIVSINKLIDILIEQTPIIAIDYVNTKGRRAKVYKLNYDAIHFGIVQLAETNDKFRATYYLTNLAGTIKAKNIFNGEITSVTDLTNFISHQTDNDHPQKIIIGIPGVELDGYLQISDIKPLQGINLSLAVKTATGIETMIVNDANATTFGAAMELNQNKNIAAGIYFPSNFGPGVGIVINDHLINGADGLAGEVEYSNLNKNLAATEQVIQYLKNIISLLNPNLISVYIQNLHLKSLQIDQIKQTIQRDLPLHKKYQLDFDRNFEHDYLIGLVALGRNNILKDFATD